MGQSKIQKYGAVFIDAIRKFLKLEPLSEAQKKEIENYGKKGKKRKLRDSDGPVSVLSIVSGGSSSTINKQKYPKDKNAIVIDDEEEDNKSESKDSIIEDDDDIADFLMDDSELEDFDAKVSRKSKNHNSPHKSEENPIYEVNFANKRLEKKKDAGEKLKKYSFKKLK